MKEILAEAKTVRELLSNARYGIDYYQREYRWGAKQIQELVDDLAGEFLEDFDESHERTAVEGYGHYFLGSVIISHKKAQDLICMNDAPEEVRTSSRETLETNTAADADGPTS